MDAFFDGLANVVAFMQILRQTVRTNENVLGIVNAMIGKFETLKDDATKVVRQNLEENERLKREKETLREELDQKTDELAKAEKRVQELTKKLSYCDVDPQICFKQGLLQSVEAFAEKQRRSLESLKAASSNDASRDTKRSRLEFET